MANTNKRYCNGCVHSQWKAGVDRALSLIAGIPYQPYPTHTCAKTGIERRRERYEMTKLKQCKWREQLTDQEETRLSQECCPKVCPDCGSAVTQEEPDVVSSECNRHAILWTHGQWKWDSRTNTCILKAQIARLTREKSVAEEALALADWRSLEPWVCSEATEHDGWDYWLAGDTDYDRVYIHESLFPALAYAIADAEREALDTSSQT